MMMLTRHGGTTSPDRQFCGGPLASHVDGFAAQLSRMGYAPNTVHTKCNFLAALSRWLERRQIPLAKLNETRLRQFQEARRLRNRVRRGDLATGQQLLAYLRDQGDIAPAAQKIDRTHTSRLVRDFEAFLYTERGLSQSTVVRYLLVIRGFLDERFGCKAPHLGRLRPQDLHDFILHEIQRVSRSQGKMVVTALRSFLRFLLQRGAIQSDLACTLPGVACMLETVTSAQVIASRSGRTFARPLRSQHTCRRARLCDLAAPGPTRVAGWRGAGHDVGRSGLGARRDRSSRQRSATGTLANALGGWRGIGELSL